MLNAYNYCLKKSNNRKTKRVRMFLTGFFVTLALELSLLCMVQLPKMKQSPPSSPVKIANKSGIKKLIFREIQAYTETMKKKDLIKILNRKILQL